MNDAELNQWMQDVLDGVATPDQAARLKERLANDPAAHSRYLEHSALFRALGDDTEKVEPPADLAAGVMRAVRKGPRPAPGSRGVLRSWQDSFSRRPVLGWSFAIGAVAAVVAVTSVILTNPAPFGSRGSLPVTGTMAPPDAGGSWLQADRAVLAAGDARGTITLLKQPGGLMARVETHSAGLAELELTFDPVAVSVTRIDGPQGAGKAGTTPGSLKFELRGDAQTDIHFAPAPAGSTVQVILRAGDASSRGTLHLN
ncbi:MAG: anti-sigma factor family protein [Gaiellaceae bacterium]